MRPTRPQLTLIGATLVAFVVGFATHAVWIRNTQEPLTEFEARLVGTWRQYSSDGSGQLDDITFLPNRQIRMGNGGMAAIWAVQDGNMVVHSYYSDGSYWSNTNRGKDTFKISFAGSSDRLNVDGGVHARATLVREL
jgi:hypothetical protein